MNILQINTSVNTGSTGRIAEDLGRLLMEEGHKSYIAYGRTNNQSSSHTVPIGNRTSVMLHVLKSRLFDRHGFGSSRATRQLVKQIFRIDPDLIHLHNIHGYYLNVELLFDCLKQLKKPVVWTFHDCWPFTGHCSHFQYVNCNRWQIECHHCPNQHGYPISWFKDNSSKNFRQKRELFSEMENMVLVSPSQWLGKALSNSFLSYCKIQVINNGIDLERFKALDAQSIAGKYNLEKRYILGVAGIWTEKKGLADFICLRDMIDPGLDIVLLGLSAKQIKTLPEGIIGIQRTENIDELALLYSGSEIFVNPTYVDNFPTVNLEAMACGTPVITYKTGGSPESVDESTGMIVDKGDVAQLAEAINLVLHKGKQSYSAACRSKAEQLYNKEERYGDYLDLYHEMIND